MEKTMATPLSFARGFSMKRNKPEMEIQTPAYVGRAASYRNGRPVTRMQISSPMALLSTSNVHVQNAQAIAGTVPIEIRSISSSSAESYFSDESDASSSSVVSSGALTDASSLDESPISPISPEVEPRRLSFFKPTVVEIKRLSQSPVDGLDLDATPKLPQRAPSHSKSAHESVHRQRSIQRMLQPPAETGVARSSFDMLGQWTRAIPQSSGLKASPTSIAESPQESPFDQELAALQEIAQEFGQTVRTVEEEEDVMHMEKYGLASFSVSDYMYEIQSLVHSMFADEEPLFKCIGGFFRSRLCCTEREFSSMTML